LQSVGWLVVRITALEVQTVLQKVRREARSRRWRRVREVLENRKENIRSIACVL